MHSSQNESSAPVSEADFMSIDETDFSSMTRPQQIRHLEVEGYLVLPSILNSDLIRRLKAELASAEMSHTSYSTAQTRSVAQPQWISRTAAELIGYPPMIEFLTALMGPEIVFTRGFFQRSLPGCPGISMHTDGQPHGSNLFGYEGSCPRLLRVLYYLDELTVKRAPFRLIPRSHLSFHADASPYVRYKCHPEEITLVVPAGSAVLIPSLLLHGSHPNLDDQPRELLQLGYRPAWAGPIQPVDEWDPKLLEAVPQIAKPFMKSLNTTGADWEQEHKPAGMRTAAPGINPSRWDQANKRPNTVSSRPGFYKVPRRFDLVTVLAVTFVYAAFFGVMNAYGVPVVITGIIIAFLTVVGMIQMLVPERRVRVASIASGWVAFIIGYGVEIAQRDFFRFTSGTLFMMALSVVLFGSLIGYIGGTVVAGVFLVADYVRKAVRRLVKTK